jgi:hypothetical protein
MKTTSQPFECPCCAGEPFDNSEDLRLCDRCATQQDGLRRLAELEIHYANVADELEMDRCYYGS